MALVPQTPQSFDVVPVQQRLTPGGMSAGWSEQQVALQGQVQYLASMTQQASEGANQIQQVALQSGLATIAKFDLQITTDEERTNRAELLGDLRDSVGHWHQQRKAREQYTDGISERLSDACQKVGDGLIECDEAMNQKFLEAIGNIDVMDPKASLGRMEALIDLSEKLGEARHQETFQNLQAHQKVSSCQLEQFYEAQMKDHEASVDVTSQALQLISTDARRRIGRELEAHGAGVQQKIAQYGDMSDFLTKHHKNKHTIAREQIATLGQQVDLYDKIVTCALQQDNMWQRNEHDRMSNDMAREHQAKTNALEEEGQQERNAAEKIKNEQDRAEQAQRAAEDLAAQRQEREDKAEARKQEREDTKRRNKEELEATKRRNKEELEASKEKQRLEREAKKAQLDQERADKAASNRAKIIRDDREQARQHASEKEAELQRELALATDDYHRKWERAQKSGGSKITGHPPKIVNGKVTVGIVSYS